MYFEHPRFCQAVVLAVALYDCAIISRHAGFRIQTDPSPQPSPLGGERVGVRGILHVPKFLRGYVFGIAAAVDDDRGVILQAGLQEVELRGRIVCLAEAMHELYHTDLAPKHDHLWGLKTSDGIFYTLLRTGLSEALFVDEHVRQKDLVLKGHVLPKTQLFEMTGMKSVRNGVVFDLY